jgi:hypothetical protein
MNTRKCSEETKRKISETKRAFYANGGIHPNKGKKMTDEQKEKLRSSHTGKKMSNETKKKISEAHLANPHFKGKKHSADTLEKMRKAKLGKKYSEETKKKMATHKGPERYNWKGDGVTYRTLHQWVSKELGKPHMCEECGNGDLNHRQYQWANISRTYQRVTTDWRRLCAKCHAVYDKDCGRGKPSKV